MNNKNILKILITIILITIFSVFVFKKDNQKIENDTKNQKQEKIVENKTTLEERKGGIKNFKNSSIQRKKNIESSKNTEEVRKIDRSAFYETESFKIKLDIYCSQQILACDFVNYTGVSKKNGSTINLKGKAIYSATSSNAPGKFLGYLFENKEYKYFVNEEYLEIKKEEEGIFKEKIYSFYTKEEPFINGDTIIQLYGRDSYSKKIAKKITNKINDITSDMKNYHERYSDIKIAYSLKENIFGFGMLYTHYGAGLNFHNISYDFDLKTGEVINTDDVFSNEGKIYIEDFIKKYVINEFESFKKDIEFYIAQDDYISKQEQKNRMMTNWENCKKKKYLSDNVSFTIDKNVLYIEPGPCMPRYQMNLDPLSQYTVEIPLKRKFLTDYGVKMYWDKD